MLKIDKCAKDKQDKIYMRNFALELRFTRPVRGVWCVVYACSLTAACASIAQEADKKSADPDDDDDNDDNGNDGKSAVRVAVCMCTCCFVSWWRSRTDASAQASRSKGKQRASDIDTLARCVCMRACVVCSFVLCTTSAHAVTRAVGAATSACRGLARSRSA
jgi:hypothetical protein